MKLRPTDVRDASFLDVAPLRTEGSLLIQAPPDRVFNCLASAESLRRWMPVTRSAWTSDAPHGVGSTRFVGARRSRATGNQVVTEWEPGATIAFCTTHTRRFSPLRSHYEQWTIADAGRGTSHVTLRFGQQLRPFLLPFEVSEMVSIAIFGPRFCRLLLGRLARHVSEFGYLYQNLDD